MVVGNQISLRPYRVTKKQLQADAPDWTWVAERNGRGWLYVGRRLDELVHVQAFAVVCGPASDDYATQWRVTDGKHTQEYSTWLFTASRRTEASRRHASKEKAMTRYRIEIEVEADPEADGDVLAEDIAPLLSGITERFPHVLVEVTSLHSCPQCEEWHNEGRGNLTYVRDHDMWCSVCKTIVKATPGKPQRGLYTSRRLP